MLPHDVMTQIDQYSNLTDLALLEKLVGRQSAEIYQGSLHPLFSTTTPEAGTAQEACLVARELVVRWIYERGLP